MKNLLTLAFLFFVGGICAQIETPAPSPAAKVEQVVGLTTVTVEYSRPSMKGRTIFAEDGLVPFGKIWRTGANAATKITFSDDVTINGSALKAGSYAVLTIPTAEKWTVNFYAFESSGFGSYVEKTPDVSVTGKVKDLGVSLENFTISFHDIATNSASLGFAWDNTYVNLDLGVEVDERVLGSIEAVMAGPSNNDYFAAASYYHTSGKDLGQALEWINKATSGDSPRFWQVRRKALILHDLGKTEEAIKAAEMSLSLAKEAGNDDYVRMNEKSIADWKNM
jgi:hypothetical protein